MLTWQKVRPIPKGRFAAEPVSLVATNADKWVKLCVVKSSDQFCVPDAQSVGLMRLVSF